MRIALCLLLMLAACSDSRDVMDELPNSSLAGSARENMSESRMDAPIARPVTIGEDGPRLDACGALGVVGRLGAGQALDLRAAPFADARSLARLSQGARLHICTRSLDQKWLGVVMPPETLVGSGDNQTAPAPVDCGVSSPVDRKQAYDGPCTSGWVSSAQVQFIAG
jgi:hypothetical protein